MKLGRRRRDEVPDDPPGGGQAAAAFSGTPAGQGAGTWRPPGTASMGPAAGTQAGAQAAQAPQPHTEYVEGPPVPIVDAEVVDGEPGGPPVTEPVAVPFERAAQAPPADPPGPVAALPDMSERPEVLVGAAFAGGVLAALILKRIVN